MSPNDDNDDISAGGSVYDEEDPMSTERRASVSDDDRDGGHSDSLAKEETNAVFRLRVMVILVLLVAAGIVSYVIYHYTSKAESQEFRAQFDGSAQKVIETFEDIVKEKLGALTSLSVTMTSYARSHNYTWPFVTINDFQQRAAAARELSDSLYIQVVPLITDEMRSLWQNYTIANKGWLLEAQQFQASIGAQPEWTADRVPDSVDVIYSSKSSQTLYVWPQLEHAVAHSFPFSTSKLQLTPKECW